MVDSGIHQEQVPSVGDYYDGKIRNLYKDGMSFYLQEKLTIGSEGVGNFEVGEIVSIVKLRDPDIYKDFILVSNNIFVKWISIDKIIKQ